jgi:hypothetical protein
MLMSWRQQQVEVESQQAEKEQALPVRLQQRWSWGQRPCGETAGRV